MSAFDDLATLPFAELHLAVLIELDSGTLYYTSAPRLFTEPTDTPANQIFLSKLTRESWAMDRSIALPGNLGGTSSVDLGDLILDNGKGDLNSLRDEDWNEKTITVKLGAKRKKDGSPYGYSDYETIFSGVTEKLVDGENGKLKVIVRGRALALEKEFQEDVYWGMGGALDFAAASSEYGAGTLSGSGLDMLGDHTVEWIGKINALPASQLPLIAHGDGYATNWALWIQSDGVIRARLGTTVTADIYLCGPSAYTLGQRHHFAYTWDDSENTARLYIDGELIHTNDTLTPTLSAPAANTINVAHRVTANFIDCEMWEARLWSTCRTDDEIMKYAMRPISLPSSETDLAECWKFETGSGTTAFAEKNADHDITLYSTPTWLSSYEGGDSSVWGTDGPLGQTKPRVYGLGWNNPLTLVDPQRYIYQLTDTLMYAVAGYYQLRSNGVPMVPTYGVTETVTFNAANKTITGSTASVFAPYIPGQTTPSRTGQQITISGTVSNNGTHTIAPEGISTDGTVITVTGALVNEGPVSATFQSTTPQYTHGYDPGVVDLVTDPGGQLTMNMLGWLDPGDYSVYLSEVVAQVLGETPDTTDLDWDPICGLSLPSDSGLTAAQILDQLMDSVVGWWVESRDGSGYRIGTYEVLDDTETPVVEIRKTDIDSVEPIATPVPSWKIKLYYAVNGVVQDAASLAASVSQVDRELWTKPGRVYCTPDYSVKAAFPASKPLTEPIVTRLATETDAELAHRRARLIYGAQRSWFHLRVKGLRPFLVDLNDVVRVTYPDHGLDDGVLFRIAGISENYAQDLVELDVWR